MCDEYVIFPDEGAERVLPKMDLEVNYDNEDMLEDIKNMIENPDVKYKLAINSVDIEEKTINLSVVFPKLFEECKDFYKKYGKIYVYMRKDTEHKMLERDYHYTGIETYKYTHKPYIDEVGKVDKLEELVEHLDSMGVRRAALFVNSILDFTNPQEPNVYEIINVLDCLHRNRITLYSIEETDYEYYKYRQMLQMLDKLRIRKAKVEIEDFLDAL